MLLRVFKLYIHNAALLPLNGTLLHGIRNRISQLVRNSTLNFGIAEGNFGVIEADMTEALLNKIHA